MPGLPCSARLTVSSTNQESSSRVMFGEEMAKVWIGWLSTSILVTFGVSAVAGRSDWMRSIASLTSCSALSEGTSILNMIAVVDTPSLTVDWMKSTPEIPATASSTSRVTCVSSSAGAAPACVTSTETIGTSIFGKRVIGRAKNDMIPSTSSRKKPSSGAIGFRMAQAEKFMTLSSVSSTRFFQERE